VNFWEDVVPKIRKQRNGKVLIDASMVLSFAPCISIFVVLIEFLKSGNDVFVVTLMATRHHVARFSGFQQFC